MKPYRLPFCCASALALAAVRLGLDAASANVQVVKTNCPPPGCIVILHPDADPDAVASAFRVQPEHVYHHALKGFAAPLEAATLEQLRLDPRVAAVESDGQIVPSGQTNSAGILRMCLTNFPVAHLNGQDHRISVDVAVLDTGIQTNHPDLNVVHAVGFADGGLNGDDWNGHGTHVAGIIGALDNDFGVVGVAPGVRLWSVQVMGPTQSDWSDFTAGCDYIAEHADEIAVVNASLQGSLDGSAPYQAIRQAVSNLVSRGIVFVAAAGNFACDIAGNDGDYGTDDDTLPAALSEAMAVSAMNPNTDRMAPVSNTSTHPKPYPPASPGCSPSSVTSTGLGIDVAAPGVGILSTWTDSAYQINEGTSMAAAHVSGLVALYVAANGRGYSFSDTYRIRQAIIDNSQAQSEWLVTDSDPDGEPEFLAMPSEDWVPTPAILSGNTSPQGFQLTFAAVPGYTYTVLQTNFFGQGSAWTPLASTNGSGSVSNVAVIDPTPEPTMRFYRLSRQPSP